MMEATGIVFFVIFYLNAASAEKGLYDYRMKLCSDLSSTYQRDLYPDGPDGGPVEVRHSIYIQAFLGLADNVLSLYLWEYMNWNDPRLMWDPALYGGMTRIRLPSKSIWQPDILLTNSVKQYTGFVTGDLNAIVNFDGNVTFVPPKATMSSCNLVENRDFDCTLKFKSWTHNNISINLLPISTGLHIDHLVSPNNYWQIKGGEVTRSELSFEGEVYPELEYNLHIQRIG